MTFTFWINIYGYQSCPGMTICVVNQPKKRQLLLKTVVLKLVLLYLNDS